MRSCVLQHTTGSEALPAPEYIHCGNAIRITLKSAVHTLENCLYWAISRICATALRTSLTCVLRRYRVDLAAQFPLSDLEHAKKHAPALIKNGAVQPTFLRDIDSRLFHGSRCRCAHIGDLQILAVDDCVVLADITGDFAEMIASYIGNPFPEPGNLCLNFLPVL